MRTRTAPPPDHPRYMATTVTAVAAGCAALAAVVLTLWPAGWPAGVQILLAACYSAGAAGSGPVFWLMRTPAQDPGPEPEAEQGIRRAL